MTKMEIAECEVQLNKATEQIYKACFKTITKDLKEGLTYGETFNHHCYTIMAMMRANPKYTIMVFAAALIELHKKLETENKVIKE